ncbi:methyl-accepting chemotaxis protein [Actinoplanes ianthinogenes]|uniref:Methyl-accepting chemotaxis protein n=1 Tax=Actinoplanes ianthinogenes TaxID=122358 RepID=A0ABN6CLI6_9ACTN|nr:methyl-accepting chemotaxis protein [Actinoplanes ianthinogenes]BCJ45854.1 methyl-accepting chemotaxis protein [Actinoplanes ianthinogenes]GGR31567.1 methyl-accepting chemotaxis protein [Actinoplanes ianthinogenes]
MRPPPLPLRPVLAITDRLRTGMRLGLLVLALLVPGGLATGMYTAEKGHDLSFSDKERQGVAVLGPALTALADTAAGRKPDLDAIRTAIAAHPDLDLGGEMTKVPEIGDGSGAARIATATGLAGLIAALGNTSNLILDPDLDSFYVMDAQVVQVPQALLTALAAAHPDTGLNTRQAVAAQAVRAGRLEGIADALRNDVATAARNTHSDGLANRLTPVQTLADTITALDKHLTETLDTPGPADPAAVAAAATATVRPLTSTLTDLLDARMAANSLERGLVLGISLGGFLLALWCAAAVLWRTSHDVRQTVAAVTAISQADLAPRPLPGGRDEMGDIGRALVVASARLQDQEAALAQADVAREQQLRAGFMHQRQAETLFRRRTQEIIDESTTVIAEELRQVTDKVSEVRTAADVIDERISVADAATNAIVGQAHDAEQVISSLEHSLRRVASTAELVTGIARQTRLLALNATIEAARAGELGYGFTVVADEVKQLAMHTAESTDQILRTIDDLRRDTTAMSDTIATMIDGIGGVGDAATSLRSVAADQGTLMGRLAEQMTATLGRVDEMTDLADRLERREHERIAAAGKVALRRPGQGATRAVLINLSAGGLRCIVAGEDTFAEGTSIDAELTGFADGTVTVPSRVVNVVDSPGQQELGLQFLVTDDAMAQQLVAFAEQMVG